MLGDVNQIKLYFSCVINELQEQYIYLYLCDYKNAIQMLLVAISTNKLAVIVRKIQHFSKCMHYWSL